MAQRKNEDLKNIKKEFRETVKVVKDEFEISEDNIDTIELGDKTTNCTLTSTLEDDKHSIKVKLDIQQHVSNKIKISFFFSVRNKYGVYNFHKSDTFFKEKLWIDFKSWINESLHQHNLKKTEKPFEYHFGERPCLNLNIWRDSFGKFTAFEIILDGIKSKTEDLLVYRIRSIKDSTQFHSYAIFIPKIYSLFNHSFWFFFPKLDSPNEDVKYYYQVHEEIEELLNNLKNDLEIEIVDIDMKLDNLFYKLDQRHKVERQDRLYGGDLVDITLNCIKLPSEKHDLFFKKLKRINKEIMAGEIDDALRDLRALIQSSGEYILKTNNIDYRDKANLKDIGGTLASNDLIDGRSKPWFEAFHGFSSQYSHLVEKNAYNVRDLRMNSWSYNVINIGKQLLLELWLEISNFPEEINDLGQFDLITNQLGPDEFSKTSNVEMEDLLEGLKDSDE